MVEIKDFGFVLDFALYNELPYYVTGYITGGCENYTPPAGYTIMSCDPMKSGVVIGGTPMSGLYIIKLGRTDIVGGQSTMLYVGIGLAAVIGIGALYLYLREKPKRKSPSLDYHPIKLSTRFH